MGILTFGYFIAIIEIEPCMEYASKIFFIFLVSIIAMGHASLQEPLDANGVLESLKNQYYPNVAISYYEIAGSTLEDLSNPMRILGPVGDDGLRHIAQVHGKVYADWSRYYDADGSCRVDNVDVSCDCEVVFPRWKPPKECIVGLLPSGKTSPCNCGA